VTLAIGLFLILTNGENLYKINERKYNYDFLKNISSNIFSTVQVEQIANTVSYGGKSLIDVNVKYLCEFEKSNDYDSNKPTIIISVRTCSEILKYTLDNLRQNKIIEHANILIIDDRPDNQINKNIILESGASYLVINNSLQRFNFSMLHNIAIHYLYNAIKTRKEVILWNLDLWAGNKEVFPTLLKKHRQDKNMLTGTKLVYPNNNFPFYHKGKINKTQFGGSVFGPRHESPGLFPFHLYRGYDYEDPKVNCDKGEIFLTGAFMILDIGWFIKVGGFNPSLALFFQDVDLCLRAAEQNEKIMYYGKDLYLYHYESLALKENNELGKTSVEPLLYNKIWTEKKIVDILFKDSDVN